MLSGKWASPLQAGKHCARNAQTKRSFAATSCIWKEVLPTGRPAHRSNSEPLPKKKWLDVSLPPPSQARLQRDEEGVPEWPPSLYRVHTVKEVIGRGRIGFQAPLPFGIPGWKTRHPQAKGSRQDNVEAKVCEMTKVISLNNPWLQTEGLTWFSSGFPYWSRQSSTCRH